MPTIKFGVTAMRSIKLSIVLTILVLVVATQSDDCWATVEYQGSCLWSQCRDVVIDEGHAYCVFSVGLVIYDITSPDAITEVARLFLHNPYPGRSGGGEAICLRDTLAYIAHGASGLYIVDVRDPSDPKKLSQFPVRGNAFDVTVDDNLAYVTGGAAGLSIISVQNPESPAEIGFLPVTDTVYAVAIQDTLAFVTTDAWHYIVDSGLIVVDVSDPTQPVAIRGYDIGGSQDLIIDDSLAYVSHTGFGLLILDLTGLPLVPDTLAYVRCGTSSFGKEEVTLYGEGRLLYAFGDRGVTVIDVNDPEHPSVEYSLRTGQRVHSTAAAGNLIYAASRYQGLMTLSDSTGGQYGLLFSTEPEPVMTTAVDAFSGGLVTLNTNGVFDAQRCLHVIDDSDPVHPSVLGAWQTNSWWGTDDRVVTRNDYAFLAGGPTIVDISNPETPVQVGELTDGGHNVAISDTLAYLSASSSVPVWNVANPAAPRRVGNIIVNNNLVEAEGDLVFAAQYMDSVSVYRVTPVDEYELVSRISEIDATGHVYISDVKAKGNLLCILGKTEGGLANELFVYSIANPCAANQIGRCVIDSTLSGYLEYDNLCVVGNYAYVAEWSKGLVVVDLSQPDNPRVVEEYPIPGTAYDVVVKDSLVYVAAGGALLGVKVMPMQNSGCCVDRVGDANGSGEDEPSIGDVAVMIDAKFIVGSCIAEGSGANITCLAEADINQSARLDPVNPHAPTCDDISIGDISILIDYLFITGPLVGLPNCM